MNRIASKRSIERREGAAMLVVLLVLLMTTATATFAIHSTSIEIRAAGHTRQAGQAEHLAEGAAYAGVSYLDRLGAAGSIVQFLRTRVGRDVASSPSEATIDRETNLLRIRMQDFNTAPGVTGLPLESASSFGPHNSHVPDFFVDGTDLYQISRDVAGTDLTGRGARFYRVTLTSLGQMAPPGDYRAADDTRSYNEVASRARAVTEVGPFWMGGH